MQSKSVEVVNRVKRSRSKPPVDETYFAALFHDVRKLGEQEVLGQIQAILRPQPAKRSLQLHPLTNKARRAQARTFFRARREFIDAIVNHLIATRGGEFQLRKKDRSLPRLLEIYSRLMSADELEKAIDQVAAKHAHSR